MEDTPKYEADNAVAKFDERHKPESMPVPVDNSPAALMQIALTKGMDLDKLEKMLELQIKWEERESKKAFVKAMAAFKLNPPDIYKDRKNAQFDSMYTSLDGLVNKTIPELSKHGFSHNWTYSTAANGNPEVTCVLTHELGHSISVTQDAAPVQSKNKAGQIVTNPIQQVKCTQTYLKITTFEAVTGLVSKEANLDDDGNAASGVQYINEKQLSSIVDMINSKEADEAKFLKCMKIEALDKMLAKDFGKAMSALKAKKTPTRQPGE